MTIPRPKDVILIIDDNITNISVLVEYLKSQEYETITALNGETGLKRASFAKPDLILLDVMMPDLDGFETCRRLKTNDSTNQIPVMFLTSLSEVSDKVKGFQAGGVDFITKPFQIEEVLARVETHLTIRRLQVRLEAANMELQIRNGELQEALATIKTISGLVPICAWCNSKIKDESNRWISVADYLHKKTDVQLSHGICPDCMAKIEAGKL
jgi:DNA-binding response OmpR family regulator